MPDEVVGSSESGREEPTDAASATESAEETLARATSLIERAESAIHDVERALVRMEAGEYRRCEVCGGENSPQALRTNPTTRRCEAHRS